MTRWRSVWWSFLAWVGSDQVGSFPMRSSPHVRNPILLTTPSERPRIAISSTIQVRLGAKTGAGDEEEKEEETFYPVQASQPSLDADRLQAEQDPVLASTSTNYMDDLTPPPINWARDSILFSENPATKRNNAGVQVWEFCAKQLPPVLTGVWPWKDPQFTSNNPLGALYNMLVVRLPTMVVGILYAKNLAEGHPLIMDVGNGPFEMSPFLVLLVLAIILA